MDLAENLHRDLSVPDTASPATAAENVPWRRYCVSLAEMKL